MEGTPPDKPQQEKQSVQDTAALPHPDSEPVETPPAPEVEEHVDVPCSGCGQVYGFDLKPNTATFTFQCRKCGTRSEWIRSDD